jgi:hypothetical protein
MTLKKWIEKVGDEVAANRLGRSVNTVRAYRLGNRVPSRRLAESMRALTGGKVGYRGCFPKDEAKDNERTAANNPNP